MKTEELYQIFQKHPLITTDSRSIEKDSIFFALKGERFNGNKYAADALSKGAAYSVIDEVEYQSSDKCILVEDVLITLQKLANYHRNQLGIPVIGITGSNGKTTTKELVSAVLAKQFRTSFTAGNFNNHIGVPLTLLRIPTETEIAVVEMGANHQGEIGVLCEIAAPNLGVINNIGKAHLEGFGGIEGIKKGKSEMYLYLSKSKGQAFVNIDLPFLKELAQERKTKIIEYGESVKEKYSTVLKVTEPFIKFDLTTDDETTTIQSHLFGKYNYYNILTAVAIGKHFKISDANIKSAIESYKPDNNRSQILQKASNTYILDAYNANPTSTQHAIEHFAKTKATKKIVILGDMLELGKESDAEHQQIAVLAQNLFFWKLILVGREFSPASKLVSCKHFDSVEMLKPWFDEQQYENAHILLKGSRGMKLEQLLKED
jgi:UDP-N-acetylmuramoyl-tripeptide--D-alanyl-D-alanine ligase